MTIYVPHSKIVIAGLDYVQPVAAASYLQINIVAEVTMPDVLSVDVITPADDLVLAFSKKLVDTSALSDLAVKTLSKPRADTATMADAVAHKSFGKKLADSASGSDVLHYALAKLLKDTATPVEAKVISFSKTLADIYTGFTEKVTVAAHKGLSDSVTMEDDVDIDYWLEKLLADTQSAADAYTFDFVKAPILDLASVSDLTTLEPIKNLADQVDTPVEVVTFAFTKALADSVTMEDAAAAFKIYIREYADSFSVPDATVLEEDLPKDESASATDIYAHVVTKGLTEETILIDNMDGDIQYAFIKVIGELLTSGDSKAIDFASNKSDNVVSSDGGVLAMQDYCDITYFAEDYVGISRTF
jgi:hypothetical protein